MRYIFDASAVIAFFKGEEGGDIVKKYLSAPLGSCCIHPVNWIELYYKLHKWEGEEAANSAIDHLRRLGVAITDITGDDFRLRVAKIKILHPSLSLGDCHAVGLAEWLKGTVVTSDKRFSDAASFVKVKQIR